MTLKIRHLIDINLENLTYLIEILEIIFVFNKLRKNDEQIFTTLRLRVPKLQNKPYFT